MKKLIRETYLLSFYTFSKKVYFLLPISIIIIIAFYDNMIFCETITDNIHDEYYDFFIQGHNLRIDVLRYYVLNSRDREQLIDIYMSLHSIVEQHKLPSIQTDTFSGNTETFQTLNTPFTFRLFVQKILLWVLLSFLGFLLVRLSDILWPMQDAINSLLDILAKNPDDYVELLNNYYQELVDTEVIFD